MTALNDWQHAAADIGADGVSRTREATADERIELARELDIPSVERLAVRYQLRPRGDDRFHFSGSLEAAVTQACVVSLEPVPATLSETFSIELAPPQALQEPATGELEVSSIRDAEPIEDGRIPVGDLVFALLSSALDPYPRQPGVTFDWVDPKLAADPDAASPFAALAKLKRDT